jgi:hypothetical protein
MDKCKDVDPGRSHPQFLLGEGYIIAPSLSGHILSGELGLLYKTIIIKALFNVY